MASPLPRDPIADARLNWERHGWSDVAAPMSQCCQMIMIGFGGTLSLMCNKR